MAGFESGRRMCLLVEAGRSRFAVEATSVVEVAPPDQDGESIRGFLELQDLSLLLGGPPEVRPGLAVVLDVSPTLALRIHRVIEVADVAHAPLFMLPTGLGGALAAVTRAALLHGDRLFLELSADALALLPGHPLPGAADARAVVVLDPPPERALVVESGGQRFGIPLPLISQVVSKGESFCPAPFDGSPLQGLFPHGQTLYPVFTLAGFLGGSAGTEPLLVLTELAGQQVALGADRVVGVQGAFLPAEGVVFLDLERMFS